MLPRANLLLKTPIKCLISLLFFCFYAHQGQAQKTEKEGDVTIIQFGDSNKNKYAAPTLGLNVKTGPLSFISGKLLVEVEKELNDLISVQGGVGITFRAYYDGLSTLKELADDLGSFCDSEQWTNDICDPYNDHKIRKSKIGPYLHTSARLFFDNEGFEGYYIGPSLTYSINRFKVQKAEDVSGLVERLDSEFQNEYERRLDFSMRLGFQRLFPKLSIESYIGLGIRKINASRQDLGYDEQNRLQNGNRNYSNSDLLLELGLRMGLLL